MARKLSPANEPRFEAPSGGVGADRAKIQRLSLIVRWTLVAIAITALLAGWHLAGAEPVTGRVVGITDGDGLTVLVDKRQVKIRLRDVDAPEHDQTYGTRSKESLSEICFRKLAEVDIRGKHRERYLATVTCAGVDANAEQVRRGMAWVFDRYVSKDKAPQLYALQAEAKAAGRGLWADAEPVAPWEWRARNR